MPEKNVLFINACVRPQSRTRRLAECLLGCLGGEVSRIDLQREGLAPLDAAGLQAREEALRRGELDSPTLSMARRFASAQEIVIAAPYWDLSFPSALKVFLEHVCAIGVTFRYDEREQPVSLCRCRRLFYVMTAGGPVLPPNHGYSYVRDLAAAFFGIDDCRLFCAQGLDLAGADPEALLSDAETEIRRYFRT